MIFSNFYTNGKKTTKKKVLSTRVSKTSDIESDKYVTNTTIMAFKDINNIFDCVCDDLMIEIMSYMSVNDALNLLKVSRRSQSLITLRLRNMSVMNRYTIIGTNARRITSSNMCAILTNCRNVKHIDFRNIELIDEQTEDSSDDNSIVLSIANGCPNVESIHFDALEVNQNFELLAKNCLKLKSISSKTINDESLKHLLLLHKYINRSIHELESLDVSQNPNITGLAFRIIGPNMKELNLNNSLIDLIPAFNELTRSYANQSLEKLTVYVNNSYVMQVICDKFVNLTELRLNIAYRDNDLLYYLSQRNFPRLTTFSINADLLKELFTTNSRQFLPKIRDLEVTASLEDNGKENFVFTNLQLFRISRNLPQLKKLVLRQFNTIGDNEMSALSRFFPYLQHLDLMGCANIADKAVHQLIDRCHHLRHLNLHNCPLIGTATMNSFIFNCDHQSLSHSIDLRERQPQFSLDVINTAITREHLPNRLPPNFSILVNVCDCVYGCPH